MQALVVGGGINGISAFRELALQGVDVLLVERGDFCGACSSAPSRMIHGGLRYLENGEIDLVRESLRERDALLRNAPHLVRPLPTTVPIQHRFSGLLNGAFGVLGLRSAPAERGALAVKIGLAFYDHLSRDRRTMPRHVFRGRAETARLWPDLPPSVRFSATYYDAWISYPERLGIELVRDGLDAASAGAGDQPPRGQRPRRRPGRADRRADRRHAGGDGRRDPQRHRRLGRRDQRARWPRAAAPEPLVGGTKGSHLILDHPELLRALNGHMIYFENVDGRVCILFPYLGKVLLGSTDIRVERPGEVRCEDEEVAYILKSLSYVFPGIAGRPGADRLPLQRRAAAAPQRRELHRPHLARPFRRGDRRRAADPLPRRRQMDDLPRLRRPGRRPRRWRILGMPRVRRAPRTRRIGGGVGFPTDAAGQEALTAGLAAEFGVLARARRPRGLPLRHRRRPGAGLLPRRAGRAARRIPATPQARSATWSATSTRARSADLLQRRTSLAITGALSSAVIAETAAILADELGWSPQQAADEERAFRALLADDHGLTDGILAERDRNRTRSLACA